MKRQNATLLYRWGRPLSLKREATSAKQAAITAIPAAAIRKAIGLCRPVIDATLDGSPKMPLPIMMLTIRAARLQRPMARTTWVVSGRVTGSSFTTVERELEKRGH